jgi:hypothetical protein
MHNIFASTREPSDLYEILVKSAKINAEKKLNKKLNTLVIKKKLPSFNFILFFFTNFFLGKIFNQKKYIELRYKNCSIGRHAFSTALSHPEVYFSRIKLFYFMIKYFIHAGSVIETAYSIRNNILAVYIDHGMYLNGLYVEIFSSKKIYVYSNNYPRGFFCFKARRKITYEKIIQLNNKVYLDKTYQKYLTKIINKNIKIPEKILPWMNLVKFNYIKEIDLKSFDVVVLAQSFTDAQHMYGCDGFLNIEHWLDHTLSSLSILKKKIIVKSHPNYYDYKILPKNIDSKYVNLSYYDHIIYQRIIKKFEKYENIYFIDEPIRLHDFLLRLDNKRHVIITHHSTALLDCAFMGFKCISSAATIFSKKFKIANTFSSLPEYNLILKRSIEKLYLMKKSDFFNVYYQVFMNPFGVNGNKYYAKILHKLLKVNPVFKFGYKIDFLEKMKNLSLKDLSIKKLSNNIEQLYI